MFSKKKGFQLLKLQMKLRNQLLRWFKNLKSLNYPSKTKFCSMNLKDKSLKNKLN